MARFDPSGPCTIAAGFPNNKWNQWYPLLGPGLENATAYCFNALFAPAGNYSFLHGLDPPAACPDSYDMISCVQNQLSPVVQLSFASAQVMLGLTPTMLSVLSPTIGEVAMLSANRPVLSFLLGAGSPAMFSFRVLEYDDPLEALIRRRRRQRRRHSRGRHGGGEERLIGQCRAGVPMLRDKCTSLLQYLLVLMCVSNVVITGLQLGLQTVLVFRANAVYMILLWSTLSAALHLIAATSWYFSDTMQALRAAETTPLGDAAATRLRPATLAARCGARTRDFLAREFTICVAHPRRGYLDHACDEGVAVEFFNRAGSFMGFILVIFGTATFSSLLFIDSLDALTVVARYVASTLVCRFVLMFELAGLAAVEVDEGEGEPAEKRVR